MQKISIKTLLIAGNAPPDERRRNASSHWRNTGLMKNACRSTVAT